MKPNYLIDALSKCEKVLENFPENQDQWPSVCSTLGNVLQAMAWFEDATKWHGYMFDETPNFLNIYTDLGHIYARLELWQHAITAYEQTLRIDPDYIEAYWYLAQIYGYIGQKDEQNRCLIQTFNNRPDQATPERIYQLSQGLWQEQKFEEAILWYQQIIENYPDFLPAYYDLGEIFIYQKNWQQAISYYQQILEKSSEEAQAYFKLGSIWAKLQEYDAAITALRQSIKIEPTFSNSYRELVKLFIQMERWDEAILTCQGIVNLVSESPWVYALLGKALIKKGDLDQASKCFQKAAEFRGWNSCLEKDYYFTQDYFTYTIPVLQEKLQSFANLPNLKALDFGSFQGMVACWLLDSILTHPTAKLTCFEGQYTTIWDNNIQKTQAQDKVIKLTGNFRESLSQIAPNSLELINLFHRGDVTHLEDKISLAWNLLKVGGILIFNEFGGGENIPGKGKESLEKFFNSLNSQVEWLYLVKPIMIKKVP